MKAAIFALLAGALFALGLVVGGMTQPAKVLGFLDFAGRWDPSLVMVMGGALLVHGLTYWLIRLRRAPLCDARFHVPARRDVDRRLVLGAAIFGVGWGLAGYCPGPALASVTTGLSPLVFVAAMLVGMTAGRLVDSRTGP
jgi:uncharacterized protein